jgi:hypothetical protein
VTTDCASALLLISLPAGTVPGRLQQVGPAAQQRHQQELDIPNRAKNSMLIREAFVGDQSKHSPDRGG